MKGPGLMIHRYMIEDIVRQYQKARDMSSRQCHQHRVWELHAEG